MPCEVILETQEKKNKWALKRLNIIDIIRALWRNMAADIISSSIYITQLMVSFCKVDHFKGFRFVHLCNYFSSQIRQRNF